MACHISGWSLRVHSPTALPDSKSSVNSEIRDHVVAPAYHARSQKIRTVQTPGKWGRDVNTRAHVSSESPAVSSTSLSPATEGQTFVFTDEGDHLEVRIPVTGAGAERLSAQNLSVDVQDDSLIVTFNRSERPVPLLVARPLYARIRPTETMWMVDEDEVVVSLLKSDPEEKWPALIEAWGALASGVGLMLKGCSINLVGGEEKLGWGVARVLAPALGYVPMRASQLVEAVTQQKVDQLFEEEGSVGVAEAEASVLSSLTADEGLYDRADARVRAELGEGVSPGGEEVARAVAEGVLKAVKEVVEKDKKMTGKKALYVKLGCRGDWPEIMPPGWAPPLQDGQAAPQGTTKSMVL